jgi:nucleoside-diphosphate-sugar epimerase
VLLAAERRSRGTFLLASGSAISMRDLATLVVEVAGSASMVEPAGISDPEEGRRVTYRIDRVWDQLGFRPRVALADGLAAWASERRRQLELGAT